MVMNLKALILFAVLASSFATLAQAQPTATTAKDANALAKILEALPPNFTVSRERREQAYAKLLEGQRYIWRSKRLQTQTGRTNTANLARRSIQAAVELDPLLSEGYTALAEIAVGTGSFDLDEGIDLAQIAVKADPDNFGGRTILARLFTIKSRLSNGNLIPEFVAKAVGEWKQVVRLDPRNAEAWAFLAAFTPADKIDLKIEYLRKWIAAATPLDTEFYKRLLGQNEELSPENARLKLGAALLKAGQTQDAIEALTILIADDPQNSEALALLGQAFASGKSKISEGSIAALQQAVFANPENIALVTLLADLYNRSGDQPEAVKLIRGTVQRLESSDKNAASALMLSLGDLYLSSERFADAALAFDEALKVRGLAADVVHIADDREFAMYVFEKLIQTFKLGNRSADVVKTIERARKMFGKDDLFADRQLISFYRSTGKRADALVAVRALRSRTPNDQGLLRLEATLLTESGNVDAAVALVRKLDEPKPKGTTGSSADGQSNSGIAASDAFSNLLFISSLYSQANRGREAAEAADQAYAAAIGSERKQIAKLTLATAQQMSGNYAAAEATLREILKQTPGYPVAMNNLGYFLLERNANLSEALDLIQKAVEIDPTNPSYLDSLGWAYFKLGKFDEAERYLKEALKFDADSTAVHEHLGDLYNKQGRAQTARDSWERAFTLASDVADVDRLKKKLGR